MSTSTPDRWVVINTGTVKKVFAMWTGGFLDGDSWQLNSGIVKVEETPRQFIFHGQSGSIYQCAKHAYGLTSYGSAVLGTAKTMLEVLSEDYDFMSLNTEK